MIFQASLLKKSVSQRDVLDKERMELCEELIPLLKEFNARIEFRPERQCQIQAFIGEDYLLTITFPIFFHNGDYALLSRIHIGDDEKNLDFLWDWLLSKGFMKANDNTFWRPTKSKSKS